MVKSNQKKQKKDPQRELYDSWKSNFRNSEGIDESAKHFASDDPKERANARKNLVDLISEVVPAIKNLNPSNDDLFSLVEDSKGAYSDRAHFVFGKDPQGFLERAYGFDPKKFTKNYLAIRPFIGGLNKKKEPVIAPISLGNEKYDRLVQMHALYDQITNYVEAKKGIKNIEELASFTRETSTLIANETKVHLKLKGTSSERTERLAKLVQEIYERTSPDKAYAELRESGNRIKKVLDGLIPEDKRGEYAMALLKAKVAKGDPLNIGSASQDLYKIVK